LTAIQTKVTKDTTPDEIETMADTFATMVSSAKLKVNREQVIATMRQQAASENGMTVEDWEAMWQGRSTPSEPEPEEEAPKRRKRNEKVVLDPSYFFMTKENQAIGETWLALRREQGVVMNLLAVGPSGCGKTEGLRHLAERFEMPFYKIDCASVTTADKWYGHKEITAGPNGPETKFVLSEHLRWLAGMNDGEEDQPGLVVYDEINRLHPSLLNSLIPLLDGSQRVWVPDLGTYINVHEGTLIAATANLGVGYSGTYGLDIALHDRFGVIIEQTFPPDNEEATILTKRTGVDPTDARKMVEVGRQLRRKADEGVLGKYVSTRALIDWARWAMTGMTLMESAEATWVKKFSEDGGGQSERYLVRTTLQGMTGTKKS